MSFDGGDVTRRTVELIVQAQGQQGVADLRMELDAVRQVIADSTRDYQAGRIGVAQYSAQIADLTRMEADLAEKVRIGSEAIRRGGVDAFDSGSSAGRRFANSLFQVSYALDDAQYGMRGLANNIPGLAAAMGASGPLGAAFTISIVSAATLYQNMDKLEDAMLVGIERTRTHSERMAELGRNMHKTAEETAEYNRLKREQAEIEAILSGKSEERQAQEKAVQSAYDEADPTKVQSKLVEIMAGRGLGRDTEREKGIQARRDQGLDALADALQKEYEQERNAFLTEYVNRLMVGAKSDPEQLRALINVVNQNFRSFRGGFLGDLERATPEARQEQDRIDAKARAREDELEQKEKVRLAAERAQQAAQQIEAREKEAIQRATEQAQRVARQTEAQEANQAAARFRQPLAPGLDQEIARRLSGGQANEAIVAAMRGRVEGQMVGAGTPAEAARAAALKLVTDEVQKVAAEAAGIGPGGREGARRLAERLRQEGQAKAARQAAAGARQEAVDADLLPDATERIEGQIQSRLNRQGRDLGKAGLNQVEANFHQMLAMQGASQVQNVRMTSQMMALVKQGVDAQVAYMQVMGQFQRQVQQQMARQAHQMQRFQMHNNTQDSHWWSGLYGGSAF